MANFLNIGSASPTPEQIARSCRRLGWLGFSLQILLGFIPLLVVVIKVLQRIAQGTGSVFSVGLVLAILCLAFLLFSIYGCFRYILMARRLEGGQAARPAKPQVRRALLLGLLTNLSVMVIAVLIALWQVSVLTFRMLSVPQGATVVTPNQATTTLSQGALITPSNLIAIQAMVSAIAAGLVGVIIALLLIQQVSKHRNSPDVFN